MSEIADETGVVDGGEAAVEESGWTGPSQEEWEQTQASLADAQQLVQAVRSQQSQAQGPFADYDPELQVKFDQYLNEKLAPYQGFQEQVMLEEAEQRAIDILSDISKSGSEFDIATARLRADQLLPQFQAKHGPGPRAAEAALQAAAAAQRDYETSVREAAVTQYQNQLRGISGAPREPAAGAAPAAGQHVTPAGGTEFDLVKNYFPNR